MVKKKQHEKTKYITGIIGPNGQFYKTGPQGEVELRLLYSAKGKKRGMYWCHKEDFNFQWSKNKNDEIRRKA